MKEMCIFDSIVQVSLKSNAFVLLFDLVLICVPLFRNGQKVLCLSMAST
jgi:hypothetical protein